MWIDQTFSELFTLKQGKYLPKDAMVEKSTESNPVPVYGANGVIGYCSSVMYRKSVPLVSCRGAKCGVVHFTRAPSWVSNNSIACLSKGEIDERFAYYLLKSFSYADVVSGSAQPQITLSSLGPKRVKVPPLPIQKRIAAILSAYDDLIEVNTRRIAILEEMARRIYEEWFVRGADPSWDELPLGDVCEKITDGAHKSPPSVEVGLPMASVKDMHTWGLDLSSARRISEADFVELERNSCRPRLNDILIAKDGANLNKHTFLYDREEEVVLLSSIAILRPGPSTLPEFLVAQLKSNRVSIEIKQMRSGAAIPRIVLKDFKRLPVLVPPLDIQRDWAKLCGPMAELCRSLVRQNANLRAQRDLLLPRLVSGRLDVSGVDVPHAKEPAHA